MLIPKYWAQHKQRFESLETSSKSSMQATIKRYGWSDVSQAEALSHAKSRVSEAHNCWLAGEDILRRERREEYNASNGIPIREEIISGHDFPENELSNNIAAETQLIVTRNSYGAQVANVDNIAIIDVDSKDLLGHLYPEHYSPNGFMPAIPTYQSKPSSKLKIWVFILVFILIASVIAWLGLSWLWLLAVMFGVTAYLWQQASQRDKAYMQKYTAEMNSLQPFITDLIQQRIISHPQESFRLYETPAGFRIIATHDTISPSDKLVEEWFEYFHADANYVRLSQAQQCFRARLTAKPWRMTEVENNKLAKDIPAKDFWFGSDNTDVENSIEQRQDELKARKQWIVDYDRFAQGYRACHYVESMAGKEVANNSKVQASIDDFVQWHDRACQVNKALPMA
ncbi:MULTISPECIES: hypothetical protein [Psychrobacter]|uniref:hypothetical protein n=1 Tax=Psychrobacter TaxID=497 RepID=UPI0019197749|nr:MULTISPECIES: hypothetical protein [Psychrobacter]